MEYRIIDTHCHPQFPQYDADRELVVRRALAAGVGMVCVGTDEDTSGSAVELASHYEGLYASVGLHPNDNLDESYDQETYRALAMRPKVVAIGEIGLDYFRTVDDARKAKQRSRFLEQLQLARELRKPVIIHCRDAHDDMAHILQDWCRQTSGAGSDTPGVIHSFNGTYVQARTYLDLGFVVGLNAIVTFSKTYEPMAQALPHDRVVLETDAPYLAPEPYRGKRNEPLYVEAVGNFLSQLWGMPAGDVFRVTTKTAGSLYSI